MAGQLVTPKSPLIREVDLLSFEVLVDGTKLRDQYIIQTINVHRKINKISTAEFTFLDGDPASVDFELQNNDVVTPGKAIIINAGYHQQNMSKIFEGVVLKVGISIKPGGHSEVTCYCVNKAHYMTVGRHNKYFTDKKDSEIFSQIIGDYGIGKDLETTKIKHNQVIQYGCCDWDFIVSRLEINGHILLTEDDKIKIKKPEFSAAPIHLLTYGTDILKSELEIDGGFQLKKVKTISWDPADQQLKESTNRDVSVNNQGNSGNIEFSVLANKFNKKEFVMESTGELPETDLEEWATAQFQRAKMSRTTGSMTCNGTEKFKPDTIVELKGLGRWFDGKAYIREVNHVLQSGSWIVEIFLGWEKDWYVESRHDINNSTTTGQMPAMEGLFIGKVKQLSGDPDGAFRIKVDIPVVTESSDGIWARLSTMHASQGHGTYYVPEIDDEVIVGFLNSDSRYPVILGSVYSAKHEAPYSHNDSNDIKGFVSRSKLKLTYDESKNSITLETPGGRKFSMDDSAGKITLEDRFQNKLEMSSSGITMSSLTKVDISGLTGVAVTGTAKVDVTSVGPMTISGAITNVTGMAQAKMSAPIVGMSGGALTLSAAMITIG